MACIMPGTRYLVLVVALGMVIMVLGAAVIGAAHIKLWLCIKTQKHILVPPAKAILQLTAIHNTVTAIFTKQAMAAITTVITQTPTHTQHVTTLIATAIITILINPPVHSAPARQTAMQAAIVAATAARAVVRLPAGQQGIKSYCTNNTICNAFCKLVFAG